MTAPDGTGRQGRDRRIPRCIVLATIGAWLVLVLAVALFVYAVLRGWQPEWTRDAIERATNVLTGYTLTIERLEGSPLEGVTLHGVRLAESEDAADALEVARIEVRVDPRASVRARGVVLDRLVIAGLRLVMRRDAEGPWQVSGLGDLGTDDAADAAAAGPPIAIRIRALALEAIALEIVADERSGLSQSRAAIDGEARGLLWRPDSGLEWPAETALRTQILSLRWRGLDLGAGTVALSSTGRNVRLDTLALSGELGQSWLEAQLGMDGLPLDARLRGGTLRGGFEGIDVGRLLPAAEGGAGPEAGPGSAPGSGRGAGGGDGPVAARRSALNGTFEAVLVPPRGGGDAPPDLAWQVDLQPSALLGVELAAAQGKGRYRLGDGSWRVEQALVDLPAGRVELSGSGRRGDVEHVTLAADALDLAELPEPLRPKTRLAGRASLQASLSGSVASHTGEISLRATQLEVADAGPGTLALDVSALGDRRYRLDAFDLRIDARARRAAGQHVHSAKPATITLDEGERRVEDLELTWSGGTLAVDGGIAGGRLLPTRLEVRSLDVALAAVLLAPRERLGGTLDGRLEIGGAPGDPDVQGRLDWRRARWDVLDADHVALEIETDPAMRALRVDLTRAGREQLHASVQIPRSARDAARWRAVIADPRTRGELRARGLDLAWLSPVAARRPGWPDDTALRGRIDGDLTLRGARPAPRIDGAIQFTEARLVDRVEAAEGGAGAGADSAANAVADTDGAAAPGEPVRIGPLTGEVRFAGASLQLDAMVVGEGEEVFRADASAAWSGEQALDLAFELLIEAVDSPARLHLEGGLSGERWRPTRIALDGWRAERVGRWAGLDEGTIAGPVWATIDLDGPLASPGIALHLVWEEPQLVRVSGQRLRIDARTRNDEVTLDAELVRDGSRVIVGEGVLPLRRSEPLDTWIGQIRAWPRNERANVTAHVYAFPLDWLVVFAPRLPLRSEGQVSGSVTLRGGAPLPALDGALVVTRAIVAFQSQTAAVGPLDGGIAFTGTRATLQQLRLASRSGQAMIEGAIDWSQGLPPWVDVTVAFDRYRFEQLDMLRTRIDGQLRARGPSDAIGLSGALDLADIRVALPSPEDPVLKEIRVYGLPETTGPTAILETEGEIAGIQERSAVDMALNLPRGTWVRGMGLDAEVTGRVDVRKEPGGELRYLGRLEVQNGRYTIQGRRFQLERGVAIFPATESLVPDLDILATRKVGADLLVRAHLTGPANAPHLELTSEPPLDPGEIVARLFLGRSADGDNGGGPRMENTAASVAGMMLLDNVSPELRESLRIDEISVVSGEEDEPPAVEIESQITPDVYLLLSQSLGASADEAAEVRWRFWRNFNLRSRVTRTGRSTVEVTWAYDYWGLENWGLGGLREPPPPYRAEGGQANGAGEVPCRVPERCPE